MNVENTVSHTKLLGRVFQADVGDQMPVDARLRYRLQRNRDMELVAQQVQPDDRHVMLAVRLEALLPADDFGEPHHVLVAVEVVDVRFAAFDEQLHLRHHVGRLAAEIADQAADRHRQFVALLEPEHRDEGHVLAQIDVVPLHVPVIVGDVVETAGRLQERHDRIACSDDSLMSTAV